MTSATKPLQSRFPRTAGLGGKRFQSDGRKKNASVRTRCGGRPLSSVLQASLESHASRTEAVVDELLAVTRAGMPSRTSRVLATA